jgi:itaconyl-CoA hydratase
VLDVRESKSRPNQGVVTVRTSGRKADGTVIITYERSFLVPTRGHAIDDIADY